MAQRTDEQWMTILEETIQTEKDPVISAFIKSLPGAGNWKMQDVIASVSSVTSKNQAGTVATAAVEVIWGDLGTGNTEGKYLCAVEVTLMKASNQVISYKVLPNQSKPMYG